MAIRPRCTRVALSHNKQSNFTTALANNLIDKVYEPIEPIVPSVELERFNDGDILKPVEWPEATDVIVSQTVNIPFNFPLSSELAGVLFSLAMGNYSVSGTGPYVHTIKPVLPCTSTDQLPATSIVMGAPSDTASIIKFKGVIPNELTITANDRNRVTIGGTFFTDGTVSYEPTFSFPSLATVNHVAGRMMVFSIADYGQALVTQEARTISATFTYNNNLDIEDARSLLAYPTEGKYIGELRFGDREISCSVTITGHPASNDAFWTDFLNATAKVARLKFTYDANNYIQVDLPKCKITGVTAGFNGIRDTLELTLTPFYDSVTSAPVIITISNGVSGYLL